MTDWMENSLCSPDPSPMAPRPGKVFVQGAKRKDHRMMMNEGAGSWLFHLLWYLDASWSLLVEIGSFLPSTDLGTALVIEASLGLLSMK